MPLMARTGKRNHRRSSALGQFREGVFQLGEEQDGHYDHDGTTTAAWPQWEQYSR